jgi:hypothetical protein
MTTAGLKRVVLVLCGRAGARRCCGDVGGNKELQGDAGVAAAGGGDGCAHQRGLAGDASIDAGIADLRVDRGLHISTSSAMCICLMELCLRFHY